MNSRNLIFPKCARFLREYGYLLIFSGYFLYRQICMTNIYILGIHGNRLELRLQCLAAALLLALLFLRHYTRREAILTAGITAALAITGIHSADLTLLVMWLFIAAGKDQDLDKVLRVALAELAAVALLAVGLYFAGVVEDVEVISEGRILRHALGYSHPNTLAMCVQLFAAVYIYLFREKPMARRLPVLIGAMAISWFVCNSRAAVVSLGLLIILEGYCLAAPRLPGWLRRAALALFAISGAVCAGISILLSIGYSSGGVLETLNALLSGRLEWGYVGFQEFGVSLLGTPMSLINHPVVLDNSYVLILLNWGILGFGCFAALHIAASFRVARLGDELLAGILAVYSVHAMMEKTLVEIGLNLFPLLFAAAIYPTASAAKKITREADAAKLKMER